MPARSSLPLPVLVRRASGQEGVAKKDENLKMRDSQ